jgi:hypothetical protein
MLPAQNAAIELWVSKEVPPGAARAHDDTGDQ